MFLLCIAYEKKHKFGRKECYQHRQMMGRHVHQKDAKLWQKMS